MKNVLIVLGCIVFIGFFLVMAWNVMYPAGTITQGEEIGMCQPTGWNLNRDAKCAQDINLPNSEANLNNGQSRVYNAQATAIVEQAEADRLEAERQRLAEASRRSGPFVAWSFCGSLLLFGLFCVVAVIAFLKNA